MGRILAPESTMVASAALLAEWGWKELQGMDTEREP